MKKTIELDAQKSALEFLMNMLEKDLSQADCPQDVVFAVQLSAEEIFVNIAEYAYPEGEGKAVVTEWIAPGYVTLLFQDKGAAYDPLQREDPDLEQSVEERVPGGLGIYIAKTMMDEISYEYRDGCNCLTMTKKWHT